MLHGAHITSRKDTIYIIITKQNEYGHTIIPDWKKMHVAAVKVL
jgi:hypothetical protein